MFDSNVFEAVNAIKPSWRNELEITDAIQYLVEKGYHVYPYIHTGWWIDTGKQKDMLAANSLVLEEINHTVEGHVDKDSILEGKVTMREAPRSSTAASEARHHWARDAHRQQLRRPVHFDLSPLRGREQRD